MTKDPRSIVRKALITEKGTTLRELRNQYHFEVARDANKIEIKRAIEAIFSVKVELVRTMQLHGKVRTSSTLDRKSTRLNSSHQIISYAVFCLKKKKPLL